MSDTIDDLYRSLHYQLLHYASDQLVCFPPSALDVMITGWEARIGDGAA
jgi:hypothetical protein